MKKSYDKIALGVALLFLIGGFALALPLFTGQLDLPTARINASDIQGEVYEPIEIKKIHIPIQDWPEPTPQDAAGKWLFQIFTSPRIYVNELEKLKIIPNDLIPPEPFGIRLVAIAHPEYRIQFEGYFGKPPNAFLNIRNTAKDKRLSKKKVGDEITEWGIIIRNFTNDRVAGPGGELIRVPKLTIYDTQLGKEMVLVSGERKLREDIIVIQMQPTYPPGPIFNWEKDGDVKTLGVSEYTLEDFDFDKQEVRVKKYSPIMDEPKVLTLLAKGESTVSEPETTDKKSNAKPPTNSSAEDEDIFKIFN